MHQPRLDITRITLGVLFIGGLLASSIWIVIPFLPASIWALTLVIATWPLMFWVQHHVGNRRSIAVLVMTIALLLVLIVPFWLAVNMIIDNMDNIADLVRMGLSLHIPEPPDWVVGLPLVGERIGQVWGTWHRPECTNWHRGSSPIQEPWHSGSLTRPGASVACSWSSC